MSLLNWFKVLFGKAWKVKVRVIKDNKSLDYLFQYNMTVHWIDHVDSGEKVTTMMILSPDAKTDSGIYIEKDKLN